MTNLNNSLDDKLILEVSQTLFILLTLLCIITLILLIIFKMKCPADTSKYQVLQNRSLTIDDFLFKINKVSLMETVSVRGCPFDSETTRLVSTRKVGGPRFFFAQLFRIMGIKR